MHSVLRIGVALGVAGAIATPSRAQFATQVVSFNQGTGGGIFDTQNVVGGPTGQGMGNGSLDVLTLGIGGDVTLGFDVAIADGPGVDFTVFENGFVFTFNGTGNYSEVAFVEVSTDGTSFARFPSSYAGPAGPVAAFTPLPIGTFDGLTGGDPVLANVLTNNLDPRDPVVSGGESFDLAALAADPLVVGGQVDLSDIRYVRLVDIAGGAVVDAHGNPIWDSDPSSSADIDAVAVVQHAGTIVSGQPVVDLFIDGQGHLNLTVSDPQGLADLDASSLHASFSLLPLARSRLGHLLPDRSLIPNGFLMRSSFPIAGSGLKGSLSVSVRDQAGGFSADQIFLQG